MISNQFLPKVYTPEQVAIMLQLSKNTIYQLISRGEIVAKKIGKVYRIPASSLSFIFTGLDEDLYRAEQEDLKNIAKVQKELVEVRKKLRMSCSHTPAI
ncbi:MAG: helix-turn-helix domain-containing protein [Candidatus Levybacteria bacterium]|nr:helix-turn-helix domain-containing protein [Candidatus Levybacteria bacterium]